MQKAYSKQKEPLQFIKPPEPCQEPFTPCWCETRPNNPHCDVVSVPIQSDFLTFVIVAGIFIYMLYIFNLKPRELTAEEIEKNEIWRLFWISCQTKWIFRQDEFYKEYFKKDGSLKDKYKTKTKLGI